MDAGNDYDPSWTQNQEFSRVWDILRDAGTRGAGGATAPLALQQEGQGGQRCPFSL